MPLARPARRLRSGGCGSDEDAQSAPRTSAPTWAPTPSPSIGQRSGAIPPRLDARRNSRAEAEAHRGPPGCASVADQRARRALLHRLGIVGSSAVPSVPAKPPHVAVQSDIGICPPAGTGTCAWTSRRRLGIPARDVPLGVAGVQPRRSERAGSSDGFDTRDRCPSRQPSHCTRHVPEREPTRHRAVRECLAEPSSRRRSGAR